MKIAIYQTNNGSASAIHWWLASELNIGPQQYNFVQMNNNFSFELGPIVQNNVDQSELFLESNKNLDKQYDTKIVPVANEYFESVDDDIKLWSNTSSSLLDHESTIDCDKLILCSNTTNEHVFFYVTQYAFENLDHTKIDTFSNNWTNNTNWLSLWDTDYKQKVHDYLDNGTLKYMWQLNFLHHDVLDSLDTQQKVNLVDHEDLQRLFDSKYDEYNQSHEALNAAIINDVDFISLGDNWFDSDNEIIDYLQLIPTFRYKKFVDAYKRAYHKKKVTYNKMFEKYLR